MKVLLVNGSPHKQGNTFIALSEVAKTLQSEGIETEIVHIGLKPIRGCIACFKCKENMDGRCVFNDDICNEISAKYAEADGFIFGSPVYYGQPNGALLSLMQRSFFSNGAAAAYKPAAAVTICRRGGATAAFQTMNMIFEMSNMPLVTSQYWNIAYGREQGETSQDVEGLQTMRTLGHNMAWMLKKFHNQEAGTQPTPDEMPWTATNFIR